MEGGAVRRLAGPPAPVPHGARTALSDRAGRMRKATATDERSPSLVGRGPEGRRVMQNVLVTGAGGFIGSHVVDALMGAGKDVTALDFPGVRMHRGDFPFMPATI